MHWTDEIAESCDRLRAERDRYREALVVAKFALMDVARTRRSDAWGTAVAEANKALATVRAALDEEPEGRSHTGVIGSGLRPGA